MSAAPALLAAAAGVAVGHAVLPDHWVPLALIGRTQRYPLRRVTRLAALAGVAHVLTSLLVGSVIIVVGLQFRSVVEGTANLVVGAALIITGLVLGVLELVGVEHRHDHEGRHPHPHPPAPAPDRSHDTDAPARWAHDHAPPNDAPTDRPERRLRGAAAVMVPFGAAASPDLTILPVFLAATTVGVVASIGTLIAFSLLTILTIVVLTVSATVGGHQIQGAWLDRWGNAGTASVLVVVGGLVLTGVI